MRLATLILGLVLAPVLAIQSILVAFGGSITSNDHLTSGGDVGIVVALLWIVGAAFVMAKPKVSMWLFAVGALFGVLGGGTGFSDLYIWAGVSVGFSLMSWRGIKEKAGKVAEEESKRQADIATAVAALAPAVAPVAAPQPAPIAPPVVAVPRPASPPPTPVAYQSLWLAPTEPVIYRADVNEWPTDLILSNVPACYTSHSSLPLERASIIFHQDPALLPLDAEARAAAAAAAQGIPFPGLAEWVVFKLDAVDANGVPLHPGPDFTRLVRGVETADEPIEARDKACAWVGRSVELVEYSSLPRAYQAAFMAAVTQKQPEPAMAPA